MKTTRFLSSLLAVLLAGPVFAAPPPRDELLRLVPEDVGFCLLVQDLRGQAASLADSPLAEKFRDSLLGKMIANAPELAKLKAAEKIFKEHLGIDAAQLRDDILGDALVAAYRPGPPGKPEEEQGLFLLRARDAGLLAGLIERINAAQKKSGDLTELEERECQGAKYYARIERDRKPHYYWLNGPVLAFSGQEAMLRHVIERNKHAPAANVQESLLTRRFRELKVEKGLLALWINPRAFDAELARRAKDAPPTESAALEMFQSYWKALDGAALFVAPERELTVGLAFRAKAEALPAAARKLLGEAAKPSALWAAFPKDALLATAGRIDLPAALDSLSGFLPEEARKALPHLLDGAPLPGIGKIVREVLPNLGPDIGFCVIAPADDDKNWLPQAAAALRVRPGKGEQPADQTLLDALDLAAGFAVFDYNSKNRDRVSLRTLRQDKVEVKYFVNDKKFPAGFQPAYALKDGYLLLASSPETVRRFQAKPPPPKEADDVPLLRMSLTALRHYLKQRREPLAAYSAEKNGISPEEAGRRLDRLQMGLQFLDHVELTQRAAPGQVTMTLRIRMTESLRK